MNKAKNDSLQGALGLLILKTLASRGPLHGYGITSHIHDVSNELVRVEEGSLYPALHRMEQDGWIRSEWGITEKNRKARFHKSGFLLFFLLQRCNSTCLHLKMLNPTLDGTSGRLRRRQGPGQPTRER